MIQDSTVNNYPSEEIVLVTPQIAKKWLAQNFDKNRKIKLSVVRKYAQAMLNGEWQCGSGVEIIFTPEGELVQGQHRLHAVIQSGTPTYFKVLRDGSLSLAEVYDTGTLRNAVDISQIGGYGVNRAELGVLNSLIEPYARGLSERSIGTESSRTTGKVKAATLSAQAKIELALQFIEGIRFSLCHKGAKGAVASFNISAGVTRAYYAGVDRDRLLRYLSIIHGQCMSGLFEYEEQIVRLRERFLSDKVFRSIADGRMRCAACQISIKNFIGRKATKYQKDPVEIYRQIYRIPALDSQFEGELNDFE